MARSRSTSRRTERSVTPSSTASSPAVQDGRRCSSASNRSTRSVVASTVTRSSFHRLRNETVRYWREAASMIDEKWNQLLRDQIAWHWTNQLRERLNGLTDDEYFWEPAPGCWSVRPRGTGAAPVQAGSGAMTIDFAIPEPDPAPFTTIGWRLA